MTFKLLLNFRVLPHSIYISVFKKHIWGIVETKKNVYDWYICINIDPNNYV